MAARGRSRLKDRCLKSDKLQVPWNNRSGEGSKPEVLSRIAQTTAALTKLKPIWRDNNLSLGSKMKLVRSIVTTVFRTPVNHGPRRHG